MVMAVEPGNIGAAGWPRFQERVLGAGGEFESAPSRSKPVSRTRLPGDGCRGTIPHVPSTSAVALIDCTRCRCRRALPSAPPLTSNIPLSFGQLHRWHHRSPTSSNWWLPCKTGSSTPSDGGEATVGHSTSVSAPGKFERFIDIASVRLISCSSEARMHHHRAIHCAAPADSSRNCRRCHGRRRLTPRARGTCSPAGQDRQQ